MDLHLAASIRPPFFPSPGRRWAQLFAVGLVVVLTGLVVGTARAQEAQAPETGVEPATPTQGFASSRDLQFDEEIAHLLREEPAARTTALNDLIQVAQETDQDLSATVGPLFHVIENDPRLSRRLKAVEALQTLGPDDLLTSFLTTAVDRLSGLLPGAAECSDGQRQA